MRFAVCDRVQHRFDPDATGTIVFTKLGEDYYGSELYAVQWDYDTYNGYTEYTWCRFDILVKIETPIIQKEEEPHMSQALWCDKGGHAFSAKDPDKEHYTSTRSVPNGNLVQQVTAELDICGPCTKDVVLFEAPQITSGVGVQDKVPGQVQT